MKHLSIVAAAIALCSCAPRIAASEAGPPPHDYKAAVAAYIKENYFDPYSIRDAAISAPVPGRMEFIKGWIVCLQANSKNRMGGYVGLRRTALLFQGDEIVLDPGLNAVACEGVPLVPWPEIEEHAAEK